MFGLERAFLQFPYQKSQKILCNCIFFELECEASKKQDCSFEWLFKAGFKAKKQKNL